MFKFDMPKRIVEGMPQLDEEHKKLMEKQQYIIVGDHSAVKVCGWTKNMLRGRGGCYKYKFYGIRSHRCLQMTSSISCANRCVFCWRDYKAPVSTGWDWAIDDPKWIVDASIEAQRKLLTGFGGNPDVPKEMWEEAMNPKHVALSLTGEAIQYPLINELIEEFHRRKISTFLVTNAQFPEQIRTLKAVTQLYISMDAPEAGLLKQIDRPLFKDYWDRFVSSLEEMSKKPYRKTIRITAIKGLNMSMPEKYAELIRIANPDFIEVKAYMYVGASRERLKMENMPRHEEVREFAMGILGKLDGYVLESEHKPSRVVLLAKKELSGRTWIDFKRFFETLSQGETPRTEDYLVRPGTAYIEEEIEEITLD